MTAKTTPSTAKPRRTLLMLAMLAGGLYLYGHGEESARAADPILAKAQDAVELYYIEHVDWGVIRCRAGRYASFDVLYCHPSGNTARGGLHVLIRSYGEPVVYPVNGTAKGQMRESTIEAVDTSRVLVRPWDGPAIDIPAAIQSTLQGGWW